MADDRTAFAHHRAASKSLLLYQADQPNAPHKDQESRLVEIAAKQNQSY